MRQGTMAKPKVSFDCFDRFGSVFVSLGNEFDSCTELSVLEPTETLPTFGDRRTRGNRARGKVLQVTIVYSRAQIASDAFNDQEMSEVTQDTAHTHICYYYYYNTTQRMNLFSHLTVIRPRDDQGKGWVEAGPVHTPVVALQHVLHHGIGSPEQVRVHLRHHVVVLLKKRERKREHQQVCYQWTRGSYSSIAQKTGGQKREERRTRENTKRVRDTSSSLLCACYYEL